ncbi:hypothetical protein F6V25_02820 [Oryzomonas japonica]|uniref:Uncharacterized protein n=2 Tax=Oryzomonas TaxID=2855184 RepID=A0A5A9XK30_9BACT|nr:MULTISPECIES: UPF0158 family protein [Oryzomonas]KAA0893542.1 hypothetical protein ET418_06965 [Oryzomonas rubra]KAB0667644.1 hypothetical protein F6V25_02820 [Oryzomonas japonica]
MAIIHNVEIVWDELMDAFTSGQSDRVYFLDRYTGEVFFIPTTLEDEDVWQQMDTGRDRFLEIPRFDYGVERQLMSGFIGAIQDPSLRSILNGSLAGRKPYGNIKEILSFFPEEEERLGAMKDDFLASRVKTWLDENNLFTVDSETLLSSRM